ncbi:MAG: N-acetyl-gamma-glutamyl-phosphate reductase [Clostridiales bacterium 43-6]|nr:MAG: N-acetyl-gamma-glutamyl-phosphate reductase [Clostridiales bacterium 43-6]
MSIKAAVVGATGYAGAELVRLLLSHPEVEIAAISSVSFENKPLSEVYPAFLDFTSLVCENQREVVEKSDVVFACLPHGLSEELAEQCAAQDKIFIDLGADFRLENESDYAEWYDGSFTNPELHAGAVYGLPELFRDFIKDKKIIANPGCYPTSVALGLYPALKKGLIDTDGIIIDAKSGVTGAGRGLTLNTHYPECNEAFSPYKVASHRHTPEIEQTLSKAAGRKIKVTFVPHLLPVNRGILSTVYGRIKLGVSAEKVRDAYHFYYENEPFVRILPEGTTANLKNVKYTNLCDISLHIDRRTGTLIVVSAIDNMVKGAAGQAIQNMNILFGLPEEAGLRLIPPSF